MKTKMLIMLVLIFTIVLAASMPRVASADSPVVPFKGSYQGVPQAWFDPMCPCMRQVFEFNGKATHLGESHFSAEGNAYRDTLIQVGSGTFIADSGDLLYWSYSGTFEFNPDGSVNFGGDFLITGGTGRFEGATGGGAYWGTAIPNGWGEIYFDGKLHK